VTIAIGLLTEEVVVVPANTQTVSHDGKRAASRLQWRGPCAICPASRPTPSLPNLTATVQHLRRGRAARTPPHNSQRSV